MKQAYRVYHRNPKIVDFNHELVRIKNPAPSNMLGEYKLQRLPGYTFQGLVAIIRVRASSTDDSRKASLAPLPHSHRCLRRNNTTDLLAFPGEILSRLFNSLETPCQYLEQIYSDSKNRVLCSNIFSACPVYQGSRLQVSENFHNPLYAYYSFYELQNYIKRN